MNFWPSLSTLVCGRAVAAGVGVAVFVVSVRVVRAAAGLRDFDAVLRDFDAVRERDFAAVLALAREAGLRLGVAAFAGAAAFAGVAGVAAAFGASAGLVSFGFVAVSAAMSAPLFSGLRVLAG